MATQSQIVQLRQRINQLSDSSSKMATQLAVLKRSYEQTASAMQGQIGGSARQADRTIVAALQAAQKKLDEAAAALQHASMEGKKFASTL